MCEQSFRNKAAALFILLGLAQVVSAQTNAPAKVASEHAGKEVLLPEHITRVPAGNDFNNPDSEFCFQAQQILRQLRALLGQGIRRRPDGQPRAESPLQRR